MDIIIRKAVLRDAVAILEGEQKIAETPGLFCSLPSEFKLESILSTISECEKNGLCLVAEESGKLIGRAFLDVFPIQSLRHLGDLNIGIHVGSQNKGVGEKLLLALINNAKKQNIEKIELNVRASNKPAIAFYKKLGFVEEGLLKRHLKIGDTYVDDVKMAIFI